MKTKNKIKANIALEANLYETDIDICVVSETHLKKVVPDANVGITNCTIYRGDREWFGNDNRAKGGVAMYIRNSGNLKILDVKRSETFPLFSLVFTNRESGWDRLLKRTGKNNY